MMNQRQEDTYFRVLRILDVNPDLTQREIAARLGLSASGLNYCLKALIERGLVKVQTFAESKNKFGHVYLLTPRGLSQKTLLAGRFLRRKLAEHRALEAEIEAVAKELAESPRRPSSSATEAL